jgi:hypothetical protein
MRFAASRTPIDERLFTPKVSVTGRKSSQGDYRSAGISLSAGWVCLQSVSVDASGEPRPDRPAPGWIALGRYPDPTGQSLLFELEDQLTDRRGVVRKDRWRSASAGTGRGIVGRCQ